MHREWGRRAPAKPTERPAARLRVLATNVGASVPLPLRRCWQAVREDGTGRRKVRVTGASKRGE